MLSVYKKEYLIQVEVLMSVKKGSKVVELEKVVECW